MATEPDDPELRAALEHDARWLLRRELDALHMPDEERLELARDIVAVVIRNARDGSREAVLASFHRQIPLEKGALQKIDDEVDEIMKDGPPASAARPARPAGGPDRLPPEVEAELARRMADVQWPDPGEDEETRAFFAAATGRTPGQVGWELWALRNFAGFALLLSLYGVGRDADRNRVRGLVWEAVRQKAGPKIVPLSMPEMSAERHRLYYDAFFRPDGKPPREDREPVQSKAAAVAAFMKVTGCRRDTQSIIRAFDVFDDAMRSQAQLLRGGG